MLPGILQNGDYCRRVLAINSAVLHLHSSVCHHLFELVCSLIVVQIGVHDKPKVTGRNVKSEQFVH